MSDSDSTSELYDVLDVRPIPPAQRHPMIFQRFAALPVGGSFVLVNDHDPKPLYYQLNFEYSGQLEWDYLERGPAVWRVRIGRAAASDSPRRLPMHPAEKDAE